MTCRRMEHVAHWHQVPASMDPSARIRSIRFPLELQFRWSSNCGYPTLPHNSAASICTFCTCITFMQLIRLAVVSLALTPLPLLPGQ